jgi:hypothetical protein
MLVRRPSGSIGRRRKEKAMFMRRRPLERAAIVGGTAYAVRRQRARADL